MPSKAGFDPITDLGLLLKQPIPTGENFEPWAFKVRGPKKTPYEGLKGVACVRAALLDAGYENEGELQLAFADLSRGRWAPTEATIGTMAATEVS